MTDEKNESQINQTREWLEVLVKDKSEMSAMTDFPWETAADIPEDELQKLYDEGRWDQEIDKYQKTYAWTNLILDPAGYETVSKKKEWIRDIQATSQWKTVAMSPVPKFSPEPPRALESRKFEWGDWGKQENAARDLVQASRYE